MEKQFNSPDANDFLFLNKTTCTHKSYSCLFVNAFKSLNMPNPVKT